MKYSFDMATGAETIQDFTIGLYDGGTAEDLSAFAETPAVNYDTQIQPLFGNFCVACHNDIATNSGGLNLDPGVSFGELVKHLGVEAPQGETRGAGKTGTQLPDREN